MRSRIASSLAAISLLSCLTTVGQDSTFDRKPILLRGQGVRPEIIGNRLVILCNPSAHSRNFTALSPEGELLETLGIQFDDGQLRLRYESALNGQLLLEVSDRRQVKVQYRQKNRSVTYIQADEGLVHLQITENGKTESRSAAGLWQMLLFDPLSKSDLIPLLEQIRPHWRLSEQAERVERALLEEAGPTALATRAEWQRALQQLASGDFATRVRAERKLRDLGSIALGWLERQDVASLDAEQRNHLQTLRAELQPTSGDTPEVVAAWLVDDKRCWLALLNREDLSTRTLAAQQLTLLCHRSVNFDPQAEASKRRQQIATLESRLVK